MGTNTWRIIYVAAVIVNVIVYVDTGTKISLRQSVVYRVRTILFGCKVTVETSVSIIVNIAIVIVYVIFQILKVIIKIFLG